ncbi:MAG: pyruvate dehydrogenase (acetyl-transferring) E1 component subunit alpha [bacterium]|nr:pyruvate dehydrogenase (acetyl-transferring) E1 component subunit alpha [bacterium]
MLQILDDSGRLVGTPPDLDDKDLVEMYRLMALGRQFDRRAMNLQRQGRLGTFPPGEGQEATQIGSAYAIGPEDWIYPSYREHAVQLARGMPPVVMLSYFRGLPNRDWDVHRYRMNIHTIPIATQLPHAVGHAYAARLAGENLITVVYFGDGATSESDFHSAMNFAGLWKTPTVFLCSNNGWAISMPARKQTAAAALADKAVGYGMPGVQVDGMDVLAVYSATREAVERARSGGGPTLIEAVTYRYGPHATADDPTLYRSADELSAWRTRDPIDRFKRFLVREDLWSDDIDEQVTEEASKFDGALAEIEGWEEPPREEAVRHVYARVPEDLDRQFRTALEREGSPPSRIGRGEVRRTGRDGPPRGPTSRWTMAQAINATLLEVMERHDDAVVMGEDVGMTGGVFRITEGLLERFGAERVIDTPLCETGIAGTAVGMAIGGARPMVEIQFDGFVYPAFDQIVSHMARFRFRTRSNVSLPIVVRWPNGGGIAPHEFHADSPEAYFVHTPGLTVVIPSTPVDAKGLLAAAAESPDPVLFLEPKVLYRAFREDVPTGYYTLPIGRARIRRPGDDVTVVTYGGMVRVALEAAEALAGDGIDCEVIDLRTLKPWDRETVLDSVAKTGRLVLVQEPPKTAGMAAEVAATVAEEALYDLEAPIVRVAGFDAPWPQFGVEHHAIITSRRVMSAVEEVVNA